jgi:hypothetical protein
MQEEYIASIFRVEEYVAQETSVKAGGKQSKLTDISEEHIASIFRVEE